MKKIICLVFVLILSLSACVSALGDTTVVLQNEKDRKIATEGKLADGNYIVNPDIPGESPTTGEAWEGTYMPMLVQISNFSGGVSEMTPWGALAVDVFYEALVEKSGATRLSFLYSNTMPEACGPVRSARVIHAWLQAEWDAGFLYYGGQMAGKANIKDVFRETGATKKGLLFCGTDGEGKPWKQKDRYIRVKGRAAGPNNVSANVLSMQDVMPEGYSAFHRPYLFADELPQNGEAANAITIDWGKSAYNDTFVYDEIDEVYYRYVQDTLYVNRELESTEETPVTVSNLIVQRVETKWYSGVSGIAETIGKGNADIFIGGRYIAGYWERTAYDQRTVFFDENGQELEFQRGKTFIAICDPDQEVTYTADGM